MDARIWILDQDDAGTWILEFGFGVEVPSALGRLSAAPCPLRKTWRAKVCYCLRIQKWHTLESDTVWAPDDRSYEARCRCLPIATSIHP